MALLRQRDRGLHIGELHTSRGRHLDEFLKSLPNVRGLSGRRRSLLNQPGPWSNRPLMGAVVLIVALQMSTVYIPALNPIFKTEPLDPDELLLSIVLSSAVFFGGELQKWITWRGWLM